MLRTTFVVLAVVACSQARFKWQSSVPQVPDSSGMSNSGITMGETIGPHGGKSTKVQQQSSTGGQASNGGFNVGTASSDSQNPNTPDGSSSSSSNTDAQSVQGSLPGFNTLGGGVVLPSFPVLPGFGPSSSQGQAGSNIVMGETIGPHGGKSTTVQQQSSTGGQASNGGFNVGTASSDSQNLNTPDGSSSSSNTDAQSVQGSLPGFNTLGGGVVLPSFPVLPGFGPSSSQGQAGSNIVLGETIGPHGGKSTTVQQQSSTGGQASNGGFNVGSASSDSQNLNTPDGSSSSSSNTDAQSVQGSLPGFNTLGGGVVLPSFPVLPGFGPSSAQGQAGSNIVKSVQGSLPGTPGFGSGLVLPSFPSIPSFGLGSATGKAGSKSTQTKTTGVDGSQHTVTVLGSSAGGSAQNGGTSVNKASGSTSSIDGLTGSQTQSHLDSHSAQTGR